MKSIKTPVRELIHHNIMDALWCDEVIDTMTWWKIYKTIDVADIVNPLIIGVDDAIRITQT